MFCYATQGCLPCCPPDVHERWLSWWQAHAADMYHQIAEGRRHQQENNEGDSSSYVAGTSNSEQPVASSAAASVGIICCCMCGPVQRPLATRCCNMTQSKRSGMLWCIIWWHCYEDQVWVLSMYVWWPPAGVTMYVRLLLLHLVVLWMVLAALCSSST